MTGRQRILNALGRRPVDRAPVCNPTSVATVDLMDLGEAAFPGAHRHPELMARLAAAGHTVLGFDSVMPVFSIVQEASALGCSVDWGEKRSWPTVRTQDPLCRAPEDIRIPPGFLSHPDIRCVLDAIRILKRQYGDAVAVIGKAMGPWTTAYHCFGLEPFLLMTVDDPAMTRRCLARLKEMTVLFALAQVEAGADALTLPDHATGDLVRASYYADFLLDIHREMRERIPVPIILHICGRTLDRMDYIAQTGMAAFHFDSKNPPREAMRIVRDRIALVGNVNNPVTLLRRGPADVRREVFENLDAGVQLIGPECAIPLDTPLENLQEIPKAVRDWRGPPGTLRADLTPTIAPGDTPG
jgi:[methyl-Co(III) methanol-specific corrinoid protein]:coenzyme M methyltransferase